MPTEMPPEELSELSKKLRSSRSPERRGAAKKIGKKCITELGDELLSAYLKECGDNRTWETQTEMIKALGKIGHKAAIPYLKAIVDKNLDFDTITAYAALSYIRLTRENDNDMAVTLTLFENGNTMVFDGAVMALAYDDVLPTEEQMKALMELFTKRRKVYEREYSNPIRQMIGMMYRWGDDIKREFTNRYKDMPQYEAVISKTLAGKRSIRE